MDKKVCVAVNLSEHPVEDVRYAAYALSGGVYVQLRKKGRGGVEVCFSPRPGETLRPAALKKDLKCELEDEALRARIFALNAGLREHLVLRALAASGDKPAPPPEPGLTPEQEKELEALIASVEKEIKQDSPAGKKRLAATWEERYGGRKKSKKT